MCLKIVLLLGIHFDENLSFNDHFNALAIKLSRSLYCINRTKNFINKDSSITLYYALIHSHLTYFLFATILEGP
jgi:hypothetical protein